MQEILDHAKLIKVDRPKIWDATLGLGGHLLALMQNFPNGSFCASDQDEEILAYTKPKILQARVVHANYSTNPFEDEAPFDFILADLGISSAHIDQMNRGISFREDSPLDMRLDKSKGQPISNWLNSASEYEIRRAINNFGEDPFAPKIARAIVAERINQAIETTNQLRVIIENVYPNKVKFDSKRYANRSPALRTFQALRIVANDEMLHLERFLHFVPDLLAVNGILAIISFHSLEDRMVKNRFRSLEFTLNDSPLAKSNREPGDFKCINRKPIMASEDELNFNRRSRSAKLRFLQRIR